MSEQTREEFLRNVSILESSEDRPKLAQAACAIIESEESDALARIGNLLRQADFLARLDELDVPQTKTRQLQSVLKALENRPSGDTEQLCVNLGENMTFLADDDRKIFLLPALAAVRPMSEEGAALFRRTNDEGYYSANAPLLVKNGSPRALELFESMIKDRDVDPENRIDALHTSVLRYRTEMPVLEVCERLLTVDLEGEVAIGVVETLFDFRSKEWFGPAIGAPKPPPWENASDEALEFILRIGVMVKARGNVQPPSMDAIDATVATIHRIQASRKQ